FPVVMMNWQNIISPEHKSPISLDNSVKNMQWEVGKLLVSLINQRPGVVRKLGSICYPVKNSSGDYVAKCEDTES
ncbi:MAG: hypothetical protein OXC40_04740, partial [Proteobacteria bacterium]|nr:hypothetical protein [Pseudomonadota bacterium]